MSTRPIHAPDGKMRLTDVADTEQLFRIIQSIPSPKAEPFRRWMAQVASTRMDQLQDFELSVEQAVARQGADVVFCTEPRGPQSKSLLRK